MPENSPASEVADWASNHRFTLLLAALSAMILLPALVGGPRDETSGLLWGGVLVAAVYAAARDLRITAMFAALAVISFGGRLGALFGETWSFQERFNAGGYALSAAFLAMTIYFVFKSIAKSDEVTMDTIMGAICVYLMIGFMWTNFYALAEYFEPGSFRFPDGTTLSGDSPLPEFTFGYYSFVTLTTLGYGDMVPISYRARTLSWVEAVVGVSYMATVLALLVSQAIADNRERRNR